METIHRKGNAQLEFVLVLVVLIPLFLSLLWSGMFGSALSNVIISARHEAWRQRQEIRTKPFEFNDATAGKISKSNSASIELTPMFDGWATAKATNIVYGGSWDFRSEELQLNKASPNRSLALKVGAMAPGAKLGELESKLSRLRELANLERLPTKGASFPGGFIDELKSNALKSLAQTLVGPEVNAFLDIDFNSIGEEVNKVAEKMLDEFKKKAGKSLEDLGKKAGDGVKDLGDKAKKGLEKVIPGSPF